MNPRIIVIDGKTYHSVDEMPPEVRQQYEQAIHSLKDADGNRVPDPFENQNLFADQDRDGMPDLLENMPAISTAGTSMKIVIDGKEYDRLEDLPPDARARYEEAMGKLDANRNGIPDFVEGVFSSTNRPTNVISSSAAPATPHSTPVPLTPTSTPDTSNGWMLMLAGLFIVLLCVAGAGAIWYFFLR